ncbi:hypothetical protein H8356DRAFT_1358264 [Neocallimastix lanati (nom. inval.)]|nr:hypothetical protein H8356DRAFT_1358264 [Neocallimastix sp. JGI-2020a]
MLPKITSILRFLFSQSDQNCESIITDHHHDLSGYPMQSGLFGEVAIVIIFKWSIGEIRINFGNILKNKCDVLFNNQIISDDYSKNVILEIIPKSPILNKELLLQRSVNDESAERQTSRINASEGKDHNFFFQLISDNDCLINGYEMINSGYDQDVHSLIKIENHLIN